MATRGKQSVDPDRVWWMVEWGAPTAIIADRLGCTERHVRRIKQHLDCASGINPLWGTERERELWAIMRDHHGYSPARIAFCTGRSRQAIHQWLRSRPINRPEDWEGSPVRFPAHQTQWIRTKFAEAQHA